jgi:hypothetical protein
MINPIFLFIDESGDPGDNDGKQDNSVHFSDLALQIDTGFMQILLKHISNWRNIENLQKEPKGLPSDDDKCILFLNPMCAIHRLGGIKCSAIFINKADYKGPYLKEKQTMLFRNFVHKQLLEFHFENYPVGHEDYVSAIFDYYRMSKTEFRNTDNYLINICKLPVDTVSHLDSRCSWLLQTAGQLANAVSDMMLGKSNPLTCHALSFVNKKKITAL